MGLLNAGTEYIDGLITYLVELAYDCLFAIFYPVYAVIDIFTSVLIYIWDTFYNFFYAFTSLINSVISFTTTLLTQIFPASWIGLITIAFFIVVALRVYSFIKDIEIFGFKI